MKEEPRHTKQDAADNAAGSYPLSVISDGQYNTSVSIEGNGTTQAASNSGGRISKYMVNLTSYVKENAAIAHTKTRQFPTTVQSQFGKAKTDKTKRYCLYTIILILILTAAATGFVIYIVVSITKKANAAGDDSNTIFVLNGTYGSG